MSESVNPASKGNEENEKVSRLEFRHILEGGRLVTPNRLSDLVWEAATQVRSNTLHLVSAMEDLLGRLFVAAGVGGRVHE